MLHLLTIIPSHTSNDVSRKRSLTWDELVSAFSTHLITEDKFAAPVYVPAHFRNPTGRNEANLDRGNLLIFDADTFEDWQNPSDCIESLVITLRTQEIASMLISSYSHHPPEKVSYRLIIPLSEELGRKAWKQVWAQVRKQLHVPCAPDKCKGMSHPYFFPSTSPANRAYTEVRVVVGRPLDVSRMALTEEDLSPATTDELMPTGGEGTESYDLVAIRKQVQARAHSLHMRGLIERSNYLKRVLAGERIVDGDGKHVAMLQVTNDLVWALGLDVPFPVYEHLLRPSIELTVVDYNGREQAKLQNMVQGAWQKRKAYETQKAAEKERLLKMMEDANDYKNAPVPKQGVDF